MKCQLKPYRKRNKEQTKENLIRVVGEIIVNEGYDKLGVNKIARQAGIDKKLIYKYFGCLDRLIEEYLIRRDYWLNLFKKREDVLSSKKRNSITHLATTMLQEQFMTFYSNKELQEITLLELGGKSDLGGCSTDYFIR